MQTAAKPNAALQQTPNCNSGDALALRAPVGATMAAVQVGTYAVTLKVSVPPIFMPLVTLPPGSIPIDFERMSPAVAEAFLAEANRISDEYQAIADACIHGWRLPTAAENDRLNVLYAQFYSRCAEMERISAVLQ